MSKNLGTFDRVARGVVSLGMIAGAFAAPLPEMVRILALGLPGLYMFGTTFVGTCLGYKLIGVSSCPTARGSESRP